MHRLGHIQELWRFPVKSMAGESIQHALLNAHGMEHDRLYAFESTAAPSGMLRLSGPERRAMLGCRATVTPEGAVEVLCPGGRHLPVTSAALLAALSGPSGSTWTLTREDVPQTDVRPLSLLSTASVQQLSADFGQALDPRRFRANLLCDLGPAGFTEDQLPGRTLRLGSTAIVLIRERIPRCRFITYDPAEPVAAPPLFALMQHLDRVHQGRTGIYAQTVVPGELAAGDSIWLLD